jgi:hypothetical protein
MGGQNSVNNRCRIAHTFAPNEIEVAPISSALLRIACLVILYKNLPCSGPRTRSRCGYQVEQATRSISLDSDDRAWTFVVRYNNDLRTPGRGPGDYSTLALPRPGKNPSPPDYKFKVYTSGQKRCVTPEIKREFKRRAAIEPVIGPMPAATPSRRARRRRLQLSPPPRMVEVFVAQNPDCTQPTRPAHIRLKSDSSRPTK